MQPADLQEHGVVQRRRPDLSSLFRPASVAVVGVSAEAASPGARTFRNLRSAFSGAVYGVNPKQPVIDGVRVAPDLGAIGAVPELVVVATPSGSVAAVLAEAGRLGSRAAIVLSAGFGEAGAEGRAAQRELTRIADDYGMAVLGPNSMGLLSRPNGLHATFTNAVAEPNPGGRVAVVAQSGGMAAIIYTILVSQGVGVDYLVALGNEATVTIGDAVSWLVRPEAGVDTIVGFAESLSGWPTLAAAARAANANGTLIALCRAGRSPAGAIAASSHVGAIAGDDAILRNLCQAHGILEVPTLDSLLDVAKARHAAPTLRGPRVGVVTASGGAGSLLADLITGEGLQLPVLSEELQRRVFDVIPWFGSATNPVDTTAFIQNRPDEFARVVDILCDSGELDAVMLFLGTLDPIADRLISLLGDVAARHPDMALLVGWGGGSRKYKRAMSQAGVATYDDPHRAVRGLAALWRPPLPAGPSGDRREAQPAAAPPELEDYLAEGDARTALGEEEVRRLLGGFGLPVVRGALARTAEDAVGIAAGLGDQVVLKLMASGLEHKSDAGGVVVGVRGPAEVRERAEQLLGLGQRLGAQVDGVLVEEQAPAGLELLCGFRRDPVAGPVVVVGLGGVLTEIVAEAAIRPAPLSVPEAEAALDQLCGGRLTTHRRGLPQAMRRPLAELLVRFGELSVALPWVTELECNPVIVTASGLAICDGLATVARPADADGSA